MKSLWSHTCALLAAALLGGCSEPQQETVSKDPRIVSLAPSLTEIVCAVGASHLLVGRTTACNYPPDLGTNVAVVGGFGAPSMEALLALKPTLVLSVDLEDKGAAAKMAELGLNHRHIPCATLDDIPRAIIVVGEYAGMRGEAMGLSDGIAKAIRARREEAAALTNTPSVYVEIWSEPLMTAGSNSFVSELVRVAGGRNIGDEVNDDYYQISSEWVLARDPEIIIYLGAPGKGVGAAVIGRRAGWDGIAAVWNGRVYDGLSVDVISRPGPRVLDAIAELSACISGGGSGR